MSNAKHVSTNPKETIVFWGGVYLITLPKVIGFHMSNHNFVGVDALWIPNGTQTNWITRICPAGTVFIPLSSQTVIIRVVDAAMWTPLVPEDLPPYEEGVARYVLLINDPLLISGLFKWPPRNTQSLKALVSVNEHERMERIVAGTDHPLHDLLHVLRYNPTIALGKDLRQAALSFAEAAAKQRQDDDDDDE